MPRVSNVKALVQKQAFDQQHRTLIMIDKINGGAVWGKFVHRYDQSNRAQVDLYFDSAFRTLSISEENVVFTADVLPILSHIGKHQISIVEHTLNGCVIINGDPTSFESTIGLER